MATLLDRAIGYWSPSRALKRERARAAGSLLARHYEAASPGRRTQGWRRTSGDANAALRSDLAKLREHARDLERNNPHGKSVPNTIADHVVGWEIKGKPANGDQRAAAAWRKWAGSTDCDADGRHDFAGLCKLVMRTVVVSGECLVRRLVRRVEDGLTIPLQLQVLEPDFLDSRKDFALSGGGSVVQGVEFDSKGRRVAYWLFREHPGSSLMGRAGSFDSSRVPAEEVAHVFRSERPGQVRGPSWFAPVILTLKDYDEYADAQMMKQKVSALLGIVVTDEGGTPQVFGAPDSVESSWDSLEPGGIHHVGPGSSVEVVQPPRVSEFKDYSEVTLRAVATGVGCTYEDITGDYTGLPFSAARMSRLRHWARVEDWRWQMLIPLFCAPTWVWVMQAAAIMGIVEGDAGAIWTAPPPPMLDPVGEGNAYKGLIRAGLMSQSEALRERGYDPKEVLTELAADFALADKLGLVLDTNPKQTSEAGLTQARPEGTILPDPNDTGNEPPKKPKPAEPDDEGDQ